MSNTISFSEKSFIQNSFDVNLRVDGRGRNDFRPVEVEVGVVAQAHGSAKLVLGNTTVIVGVKIDVGTPDADFPDQGFVKVQVSCSACASPQYQGRFGEEANIELSKELERVLAPKSQKQGGGIDLSQLSIVKGQSCWIVYVDGLVLNDDGNLLDALSMAARCALATTMIPKVDIISGTGGQPDEYEVDEDPDACTTIDVSNVPIIITLSQVGKECGVDLIAYEEKCVDASIQVAVGSNGKLCGVNMDSTQGLAISDISQMIQVACVICPDIVGQLDNFIIQTMST
eukprot:TRINITY_DN12173_c1_g1_i1.p2 TRINITY_DN12173_c1_g1~~TRINITY_DN12173_c1_g1_i1.p2  ORF type:complete len:305 (+),score=23.38 TRINITY_DN12173_c1_g1_i1:58-915(+)